MSINLYGNQRHVDVVLKRFAIGAALCLSAGNALAAGLPAVIYVVTDTEQLIDGPYATIDNQTVVSVPLGDIDGDGLGDRYIEVPAIDDDLCPGIAIVPSSLRAGLNFSRDELDALIRIVDTPVSSTATLANGNSACRYWNVRGFSEPRRMGDINGDGLTDLIINVSGIFDNTPRIVFGSVTAGTRIDLDLLDGNTGFSAVGGGYVVFPVGDVNNDGLDDIGHWQGSSIRSFAEAEGLLGVIFDLGTAISPVTSVAPPPMGDMNDDGLSDFVWTSRAGTPFVAGRPRDLDGIDPEELLVRRGPETAFLSWQAVSDASEYRVQVNDLYVADIAGDATTMEVADVIDDAAALYSVDARIVRTEVSRDGTLIGASPGNSFFDDTREPGRAHRYALVAIDADGERSAVAEINTSNF